MCVDGPCDRLGHGNETQSREYLRALEATRPKEIKKKIKNSLVSV